MSKCSGNVVNNCKCLLELSLVMSAAAHNTNYDVSLSDCRNPIKWSTKVSIYCPQPNVDTKLVLEGIKVDYLGIFCAQKCKLW